jgi:hypothetical protein
MFAVLAVMAFGAGLAFAPAANAAARKCPVLCKTAITGCQSRCQTGDDGTGKKIKKKKCKLVCRNTILKVCKKAKATAPTTCSPSGAFVD